MDTKSNQMLLNHTTYFVKERVAFAKLTDTYDILDPQTQQIIGIAKEEPAVWAKWLRILTNTPILPTTINVYEREDQAPILSIHRPSTLFRTKVNISDSNGQLLGYFKSKLFSVGGGFYVFDTRERQVAEIVGDWKGWNFKFLGEGGLEIGTVTKKWAGIGKELFTSADNYIIALKGDGNDANAAALLLAAGLAIDIVYKEGK